MQYFINAYPPLLQTQALADYARQSVVCDGTDPALERIRDACRRARVAVSLGVSERLAGGYTLFNAQVYVDAGGALLGVHRKLQPTLAERYVWAQGDGSTLRTWDIQVLPQDGEKEEEEDDEKKQSPGANSSVTTAAAAAGAAGGKDSSDDDHPPGLRRSSYTIGGLCCWEHAMNGARQALLAQNQHVHCAAWPALSTLRGLEAVADAQIEALMRAHALTAQAFVLCASSPVDDTCLAWMEARLGGPQALVGKGGGWSAVVHPFCAYLAGPHAGGEERLLVAELDFGDLGPVKAWIDGNGHYKRPEVLGFTVDRTPLWPAPVASGSPEKGGSNSV